MNDFKKRTGHSSILYMLLICTIVTACESEIGRKVQPTGVYYDVASFLDQQLQWLDSLGPDVEKMVEAEGVKEVHKVTLDSLGWAKELEVFYKVDINDPILKDAYEKSQSEEDVNRIVMYNAKESNAKVQWLRISYHNEAVAQIAARIQEDNVLYKSKSNIELDFDPVHEPPLLLRYAIQQSQKILFRDTAFYSVEGQLNW